MSSGDEQIADRVVAERVRRKVVEISRARLKTLEDQTRATGPEPGAPPAIEEEKYWLNATLAESLVALGDDAGKKLLRQVVQSAPAEWMARTTITQVEKLKALLHK